jgi:5-methylcytosine-specific restriction endonuclease McrA
MNRWNIPVWLEKEILERDKYCVYCGTLFGSGSAKGSLASWEHIVNDANIITRENIALCCRSCNSSKGAKILADWLKSEYCRRRGIDSEHIADIVKRSLRNSA